ncbi:MAG: DUF262 domain-containing protein [Oscillospiraceae bacterium]
MADTYIKYNDHSISSAFKDHYIVPDYQREYVWKDEQIEQLTSDLIEAYNADNKKAGFSFIVHITISADYDYNHYI